MIRIYLKQAFRSLVNQKTYSFVIIIGLSIAIAISFLILSFVQYEKSFDNFHEHAENLYRINVVGDGVGKEAYKSPYSYAPQGPIAVDEIPEISEFVRLLTWPAITISSNFDGDKPISISESDYYYADETFFELFSFPLIQGGADKVLSKIYSVVLSQSLAKKLYGNTDPVGEKIKIDGDYTATITGIFKDIPENSHLKFNLIFSLNSCPWIMNEYHAWSNHSLFTYVLLDKSANPRLTEQKLKSVFGRENRAKAQMDDCSWELQNISNAYLNTADFTSKPDSFKFGNSRMVYFLNLIAFLIIIIAWINYINISTSKATERGKEIGVRRSNGARKVQLLFQFFTESLLFNILSIVIAAIIAALLYSWFKSVLSFSAESILHTKFNIKIAGILGLGILVSGLVTSISIVYNKKSEKRNTGSFFSYRHSLVILQFIILIGLIAGVFVINKQLKHLYTIDLGFQKEQIIVLNAPRVNFNFRQEHKLIRFRDELKKLPLVEDVTASVSIPGSRLGSGNGGPLFAGKPNDNTYFRVGKIMPNFIDFYEIGMLAGRNFGDNEESNKHSIIINQEAVHEFGYQNSEEILGKHVQWIDGEYEVIGVTNSFHQQSLHIEPEPAIFYTHVFDANYNYISLKVKTSQIKETLAGIESVYHTTFPDNPFDYFFLDAYFDQQYQKDILFRRMFNVFSVIALLIGYFGLYGLTTYRIIKRTKEIGIRKVNGAKIHEVIGMLSTDFIKWIAIAFILAAPIAYYALNKWLENFAYKTELSWWIFALAGVLALGIALLTVSWQSWRAASRNPVEALRYE